MESSRSSTMATILNLLAYPTPTLQEIAAFEVASNLLHRALNLPPDHDTDLRPDYFDVVASSLDQLLVPSAIREIIKTRVSSMIEEAHRWLDTLNLDDDTLLCLEVPDEYRAAREVQELRYSVWQQNCTIDDGKSARNLCSSGLFGGEENFAIMSKYCLREEIDKVELEAVSGSFLESATFVKCPLLYYWICFKKNELQRIPIGDEDSLDEFMLCNVHEVWDTWPAAEFFWDRLPVGNQSTVAMRLILANGPAIVHERRLLAKMSPCQLQTTLVSIPFRIIRDFWVDLVELEIAYAVWMHVKDVICERDFAQLVRILALYTDTSRNDDVNLLVDLWNSAADNLKAYVMEHLSADILKRVPGLL